jgi:hypothetical protein
MDRLNSLNLSNNAADFLEAVKIVRVNQRDSFVPLYFLVCQSIELSMKAVLRGDGFSDRDLRKLGHDLEKCLRALEKPEVGLAVKFTEEDLHAIRKINPYYKEKDLQYVKSGAKSFPEINILIELAGRLFTSTREFCIKQRDVHTGKTSAVA